MEKLIEKLDPEDVKALLKLMRGADGKRSALATLNSGIIEVQGETRRCYSCGEVRHLSKTCPKLPKERETGGRGQPGGRGGCRGGRDGPTGGYRANLKVLERKQRKQRVTNDGGKKSMAEEASTLSSSRDNIATYAHSAKGTRDTHALVSISTTRSPEWIVDSGASRHVTGTSSEFSSYTHLAIPESIQTADDTAQPVIGKGTVICTIL